MTIYTPRRSRRLAEQKLEKTQQMIAFILGKEWFALPIDAVQKVVTMGKVYGDPQETGISLTHYQDQELLVIDVARCIFGITSMSPEQTINEQRFLLVIQNQAHKIVGLPIDSPPSLRRIPASAFMALPEIYLTQGNINCISSTMIQVPNQEPLFLLDVDQLSIIN
ncbi:chemotaxis protein CheW [Crocosphaera sp. XPORK-15E]|uniref:chemotaxis protein CheW n=1 Tax=Crocosphaera sp. XPORK-15E TaxID=3110247 RepID=UPI002B1F42BC|nr:chemotaxis protein CheW [Crocosphaera sp. XPORK-15E]MEA5535878.1 chemotaxis protein CheW [Crocosphaera sp. XPORK-15E]